MGRQRTRKKIYAIILTFAMLFGMLPGMNYDIHAMAFEADFWQGGTGKHVDGDAYDYGHSFYVLNNYEPISYVQIGSVNPYNYDPAEYHYDVYSCSCGAQGFCYSYHNFDDTGKCEQCGYQAGPFYVTVNYTLESGVETPSGWVSQEKLGPYDYGTDVTTFAKSYKGLKASLVSGTTSGSIRADRTVEFSYNYADPCPKGQNHNWTYAKVDDSTHKYYCSKCNEILSTGNHDKNGVSNRSLSVCQYACSDCGFKKTFTMHNFETYTVTGKDGGNQTYKVCKNCGFETTDCEHEWETEGYIEEGSEHVRVCKLCGYEDRHEIDADGSWLFVREADCCRVPCCRRCKQATWQAEIGDPSELCHEITCEQNGGYNTHRAYCSRCGYVFDENAPCFQMTEWMAQYSDVITADDLENISSKLVNEHSDGTATLTCACGNTAHVDKYGRYVDGPNKGEFADPTSDINVDDENGILDNVLNVKCEIDVMVSRFTQDLKEVAENKMKDELMRYEDDFWSFNDVKDAAEKAGVSEEELKNRTYEFGGFVSNMKVTGESEKVNDDGSVTKTLEYDISMKYKYTVTAGGKDFEVTSKPLTIDEPTRITVTAPPGFGKDGDTIKVEHEHDGSKTVYYGTVSVTSDGNGEQVTLSWTSERGLSPFKITLSDSVQTEYEEYLKDKIQNGTAAKADPTFTAPAAKTGLIENGSAQELISAGSATGGLMKYAITTDDKEPGSFLYFTSVPKATGAGTYYVWYKVSGDATHSNVAAKSLTVTIGKQDEAEKKTDASTEKPNESEKKSDTSDDKADVPEGSTWFASYEGRSFYKAPDGNIVVTKSNGKREQDAFVCDGTYTYYVQYDGTAMKDRLTYHPDGEHVIYFDSEGHEVFSDFANVKKTIAGEDVNDFCFFNVFGYMYVDVITYDKTGTVLYYANPYGVMEVGKWFQFSDSVKWADDTPAEGIAGGYGYANEDGTLMKDQYTYDWEGRYCYMQGNGVALY